MSTKRTLKSLTLDEKFNLIKDVESGSKKKDLAVKYGVPASTVSTILKNKETIVTAIENGGVSGRAKRVKKPTYENVDKAVLEWFNSTSRQNLPIPGELIKGKALHFSQEMGLPDFKASTGWLDNWKRRNGIGHKTACGENKVVNNEESTEWKHNIFPHFLEGYQADETIKCRPDKTLTPKKQKAHERKHRKQKITFKFAKMKGSKKQKGDKSCGIRGRKCPPIDSKPITKSET